jgi:diguanylate cyclase (GGDEF)-like protein/PAS domain S-box-containing protein
MTGETHNSHTQAADHEAQSHHVISLQHTNQTLSEQCQALQHIIDSAPVPIYVYDLLAHHQVYTNQHIGFMLGYNPEHTSMLAHEHIQELVHPDDRARWLNRHQSLATLYGQGTLETEYRMRHADGTWRWLQCREVVLTRTDEGTPWQVLGTLSDITPTYQTHEQLSLQASALAHVHDAVIALDITGHIRYWNQGAELIYGLTHDEVIGQRLPDVYRYNWFALDDRQQALNLLADEGRWQGSSLHRTRSGNDIFVELSISTLPGPHTSSAGWLVIARDITAHRRAQDLLQWRNLHDTLTHLPNRLLFLDRLSNALEQAQHDGVRGCAVLFLDLDNFKVVNDSLGHMVGDRMLITVARRIEACLPAESVVARFGGDEFILLLEPIHDAPEATSVADRIHNALRSPIILDQYRRMVTSASIGIALSAHRYRDPEDLLRDANVAMHHAKRQGGGTTVVFDTSMSTQARERLWVETELRQALDREELIPFYQALVSLATGRVVGFEVLTRWKHPQRGWIFPNTFIQIAEETGLIGVMDQWILQMACRQAHHWVQNLQLDPAFTINVNISGREFLSANLAEQVSQALRVSGLEPYRLKLEITESVAMDHAEVAVNTLQTLRALGVQVALDDFGMGYSSLRYLPRFPIQTIKIDRSFVSTMGEKVESETIVRTIVSMAHSMGLDVVAEGIETDMHRSYLEAMHCDYGQGYLFSKPINAEEASLLLMKYARNRI